MCARTNSSSRRTACARARQRCLDARARALQGSTAPGPGRAAAVGNGTPSRPGAGQVGPKSRARRGAMGKGARRCGGVAVVANTHDLSRGHTATCTHSDGSTPQPRQQRLWKAASDSIVGCGWPVAAPAAAGSKTWCVHCQRGGATRQSSSSSSTLHRRRRRSPLGCRRPTELSSSSLHPVLLPQRPRGWGGLKGEEGGKRRLVGASTLPPLKLGLLLHTTKQETSCAQRC